MPSRIPNLLPSYSLGDGGAARSSAAAVDEVYSSSITEANLTRGECAFLGRAVEEVGPLRNCGREAATERIPAGARRLLD